MASRMADRWGKFMGKTLVKLATAMTCLGLACPGVAAAQPLPGVPDIPEIDETYALNYALEHQREICAILDYRFAQAHPVVDPIESMITEVAQRGGFNYETAGFVIGAAMASSCPQHIAPFEDALGVEIAPPGPAEAGDAAPPGPAEAGDAAPPAPEDSALPPLPPLPAEAGDTAPPTPESSTPTASFVS